MFLKRNGSCDDRSVMHRRRYRVRGTLSLGLSSRATGLMTHLMIIRQGFDNWGIVERDPTMRSMQNLFGGRFVGMRRIDYRAGSVPVTVKPHRLPRRIQPRSRRASRYSYRQDAAVAPHNFPWGASHGSWVMVRKATPKTFADIHRLDPRFLLAA